MNVHDLFKPHTYKPHESDSLERKMLIKIHNVTAQHLPNYSPLDAQEIRAIHSAAVAGIEGPDADDFEPLRRAMPWADVKSRKIYIDDDKIWLGAVRLRAEALTRGEYQLATGAPGSEVVCTVFAVGVYSTWLELHVMHQLQSPQERLVWRQVFDGGQQ